MWSIALRDLQMRRRRFITAVIAVGLVFGITLLLDGFSASLRNEAARTVATFKADEWLVSAGGSGPFTPDHLISQDAAAQVRAQPGVRNVDPLLVVATAVQPKPGNRVNVNVLGTGDALPLSGGRWPARSGEVVVNDGLNKPIGSTISMLGAQVRVVGEMHGVSYFAGTNVIALPISALQQLFAGGQRVASALVVRGHATAPSGFQAMTNAEVRGTLTRAIKVAASTVSFLDILLWIVAAGIIGTILYMTALERTRDFAALKAMGARNHHVFVAIAAQAVVLSLAAGLVSIVVSKALAPSFPITVEVPTRSYPLIFVVALALGLVGSLAGVRRAVATDPALAFGG